MRGQQSKIECLRELVKSMGVLHPRDLRRHGIPERYLGRLCEEGVLIRCGRGIYVAASIPETMHLGIVQAAKVAPHGVVCLLSALRFHEIGTQMPHQVWMALNRRNAVPKAVPQSVFFVYFSGAAYAEGIEQHDIAGASVNIYSPAKTVADCFKYRNKIGLDVALEALKSALQSRKCTLDEIWYFAGICRVAKVMRPYLEALA